MLACFSTFIYYQYSAVSYAYFLKYGATSNVNLIFQVPIDLSCEVCELGLCLGA